MLERTQYTRTTYDGKPNFRFTDDTSRDHYASKHRELIERLQTRLHCYHCKAYYTLWASLGRLDCRYHPGRALLHTTHRRTRVRNAWACCGKSAGRDPRQYGTELGVTRGCMRCDHNTGFARLGRADRLSIPLAVYGLMPLQGRIHVAEYTVVRNARTGELDLDRSVVLVERTTPVTSLRTDQPRTPSRAW